MTLAPGSRLGAYEILTLIGSGGMGEVYKARDTRLDRAVAVKILPAALSADPQFRERFDREARAISQLTDPHICTLHDVGEQEGTAFLVMELLEGETLEDRLAKGPLPFDQALTTAIEIASALAAAHRAGIVHRDLKPGNVMLTKAGAKLLDFGLAKTTAPVVATSGLSMVPTTPPAAMTAAGTILGTFQYMAPEQIEGLEADARTDIFAFGCVLFEMLTGRKAFEGKTRTSLLGAILKDEPPPVSQVQPIASTSLDRIVTMCLAKEPDDRWQSARDLMRELKWVAASSSHAESQRTLMQGPGVFKRAVLLRAIAATAIVTALIVGLAMWMLMRPRAATLPLTRFLATAPASAPLAIDIFSPDLAISPDGSRIVYTATGAQGVQLFVRPLDQVNALPLAGTGGARGPFFSPDGEWVAYFQGLDLKKVSIRGGPSLTICSACSTTARGASWGEDDTIVFGKNVGGLQRVSAAGGEPIPLTTVDSEHGDQGHVWPEFVAADVVLFTINTSAGAENGIIVVRDLTRGTQKILIRGGSEPHYLPTGHIVYGVAGTLRAVAFDLRQRATVGNPVPVVEGVAMKASGTADFSLSRGGTLAYVSGDAEGFGLRRLAWVDRQGHEEAIPAPRRAYLYPRLSPDGGRIALDVRDQQNDIWIWNFARGGLTRLTTGPAMDTYPVWTPDGRRVAYASAQGGVANLYWQLADGTGAAERLTTGPRLQYPWAFTRDGKALVLRDTDQKNGADVSLMATDGDRTVKPLIHSAANEFNAELSPDGTLIAYQSNESGRDEIHVRPFPAVESGHWQVTNEGGSRPLWARNGRELFYKDLRGRIMSLSVQGGETFSASTPTVALDESTNTGSFSSAPGRDYDVSLDGKRFLVLRIVDRPDEKSNPPQLTIVLNWGEELKRLAPTK